MLYSLINVKSLLSPISYVDCWFHSNCSLNAYRGCEFACAYCDGMSEHYHVDNFQTHIRVKANAPEILRRELIKLGYTPRSSLETESLLPFLEDDSPDLTLQSRRGVVIGISGGISDAYQPAEEQYQITRQILKTILDFEMPVTILTKSTLVIRDLDILKEIHERAFVNVYFTITLHDEDIKRIFEPKSPATWERFAALKEIRRSGLYGGVIAMPIIPGIGTTEENIRGLVRETKRAGGEFIQFSGLTLKPGRQKDYFMSVIKRRTPNYHEMLQRIYENNDYYGNPIYNRLPVDLMGFARKICKEEGIRDHSIRHRPPWMPEINHIVLSTILDMIFIKKWIKGIRDDSIRQLEELAKKIELEKRDLKKMICQGGIRQNLCVSPTQETLINEIVDSGGTKITDDL